MNTEDFYLYAGDSRSVLSRPVPDLKAITAGMICEINIDFEMKSAYSRLRGDR
jgi:hypothetical protein